MQSIGLHKLKLKSKMNDFCIARHGIDILVKGIARIGLQKLYIATIDLPKMEWELPLKKRRWTQSLQANKKG